MNKVKYKTIGEHLVGLSLEPCKGHSRKRAASCIGTLGFLMDALSSVSEQTVKIAKNWPFLLIGLCLGQ